MSHPTASPPAPDGAGGLDARTGAADDRTVLERFSDVLTAFGLWAAMAILLGVTAVVSVDVVMRNFFSQSLMIVDEVVGQLTVAFAFLGISYALRQHALLRVELIYSRLKPLTAAICRVSFGIASLVYVALIVWFGIRLVRSSLRFDVTSVSLLKTPMWIPQLVIPIGGALLALALIAELLRDIRSLRAALRTGNAS